MNHDQRRCVDLVAEHAGVSRGAVVPGARFAELGVRLPRLLAAIEEALTVTFDGDTSRLVTVGDLLALIAKLPRQRVYAWPPFDLPDDVRPADERSTRGALAYVARNLRNGRPQSAVHPAPTSLATARALGHPAEVLVDGVCTKRGDALFVDDVRIVGAPDGLRVDGEHLRVEGWLRRAPSGLVLEAFAIEALHRARVARTGLHIDVLRSSERRDETAHTPLDVLSGTIAGHSVVLVLRVGGKAPWLVARQLRGCFERWAEGDGDGSVFVRWDDAPSALVSPHAYPTPQLPGEADALFAALDRELVDVATRANGGEANLVSGCLIVRDGARSRIGRTGLHRVVLVHEGRVETILWEHSLAREPAAAEASHPTLARIALSAFVPESERQAPVDVVVPEGARLVVLSGDTLELPLDEVERALLEPDLRVMAAKLEHAPPMGPPEHGIVCIAPNTDAPTGTTRPDHERRARGWARPEHDRLARSGALPRWLAPTPSHVARRLTTSAWVTIDARYAEDIHFEDPRFDGLELDGAPYEALAEGELYRAEGWLALSWMPDAFAARLDAVAIEARRSATRILNGFEIRAHRGRIPVHDLPRTLVAPLISHADVLAVPRANGVSVALIAATTARDHDDARACLRTQRGPVSVFTVREGPSPTNDEARSLSELPLEAVGMLAATDEGSIVEASRNVALGRATRGSLVWTSPSTAALSDDDAYLLVWGVETSAPELALFASGGIDAVGRALELAPPYDRGDWAVVSIRRAR